MPSPDIKSLKPTHMGTKNNKWLKETRGVQLYQNYFYVRFYVKPKKGGFLTSPAPKKISPKFMTEIIDTIHFFWAKKIDIMRLNSFFY